MGRKLVKAKCMTPMVSAIITTHNRCELLKRAIESVLIQDYTDIECIVVDDASSDGTQEYCEGLSNIKYIRIPADESRGGNYARNVGIKSAKGEYVALLDDDDYWLPSKIRKQVELIVEKKCGVVYCPRRFENVDGNGKESFVDEKVSVNSGDLSKKVFTYICSTTSCVMIEKRLIDLVGGFDESLKFWQEYDLLIRLAQATEFYSLSECLVVYRVNPFDKKRLTNKYYEWVENTIRFEEKHKQLIERLPFSYKIGFDSLREMDAKVRAHNSGLLGIYIYKSCISFVYRLIYKCLCLL